MPMRSAMSSIRRRPQCGFRKLGIRRDFHPPNLRKKGQKISRRKEDALSFQRILNMVKRTEQ